MVEVQVIIEQVRSATVVIATGPPGRGQPKGSGFFIAPGRVLTCAHVVEEAGNDLFVWWFDKYAPAKVHQSTPRPAIGEARQGDAAVLYVESEDHACVPLAPGPAQVEDRVWVYGVSKVRGGRERPVEFDGALLDISATPVAQGEVKAPYLTRHHSTLHCSN